MRLDLSVRDLVLASWPVEAGAVRRVTGGLEPAEVGGRCLVSLVAIRFGGGRLGRVAVPGFSQLNVRTYVEHERRTAVFFVRSYVTAFGLAGILFGAPFRFARMSVGPGAVSVPGAGVELGFSLGGETEPGELGRHETGLYEAGGLRRFDVERGPAGWRAAELVGEPRADVLAALGFDVSNAPSVVYASGASFRTELPSRKASRSAR